ncbi:MAG: hypothetical protein CL524_01295 [Aequorivita sp.]|nr:hypothetical protein [Aequorivita sp.]
MATILPIGVQAKYFAKVEATYDTVQELVAADAVPLIDLEITPTKEFHASKERVGSASLQREVAGVSGGTWSASFYAKPNGSTVTTAPDVGVFLKAAFGDENTSSDVSYRFTTGSAEVFTPTSLQLARYVGEALYETISGCWIESCDVEIVGNAETVINVSGGFASFGYCYGAQINGAISSTSATTVTLDSGTAERLGVGARIQFKEPGGTVINGAASTGFRVTYVNTSADIITFTPAVGATVADDSVVQPFTLAQTLTTNNPLGGVGCGMSIGGTAVGMISFKVSIATGIHGLSAEATASKPNRLAQGARSVTGTIESYFLTSDTATEDISRLIGTAHEGGTLALIARAGEDTTKQRMKINVPAARLEVTPVAVPEAEEATVSINFVARQASAVGDECSIDFD